MRLLSRTPNLRASLLSRWKDRNLGQGRGGGGTDPLVQDLGDVHVSQLGVPFKGRHGKATPLRRALLCLHAWRLRSGSW